MQHDQRAIRVFVSSTFRDMQLERDELVKRVFPQVRRLCERRGVSWSEVDLRWGVTDEQKADGAVLPICLAEIERTRPYFIGLIGQRYGWVPDELPSTLVDEFDWLDEDRGRSVTELEILHGVLNDPDATGSAYFYLRDPAWVETLPVEQRSTFVEETPDGRDRLAQLRTRIEASGHPVAHYPDPVALGDQVLADLTALLERSFPDDAAPSTSARQDAVHLAFGEARFGTFVARPELAAALDRHAAGDGAPLLVTGAPGSGGSALVTDWARSWAAAHPTDVVVVHHVDADVDAADHRAMAARLIAGLGGDPETGLAAADASTVRSAVRAALREFSGRAVVVIDNADRLDDVDGAPDLRWLPSDIPDGVRVIVTASTERPVAAFRHRQWPLLEVPPLSVDERRAIAAAVLAVGAKGLDTDNMDALVGAGRCGNARFLRTVLDELRQHGDHFTLRPLIDRLVAAATLDDLLEMVLARYEADFERDRPGLTRDVFIGLWAARHGLAEAELLEIVAAPGQERLSQAVWAPLHLAAEHGLVSRGGLLGFAHPDMRRAVEDRYLTDDAARRRAHATLASYFADQPLSGRVTDELGWQQADSGDNESARTTLTRVDFVELAYTRDPADVRRLWTRLEGTGAELASAMRAAYEPVLADPASFDLPRPDGAPRQLVWGIARLLGDAGASDAALPLHVHLVAAARLDPAGSGEGPGGDAKLRAALVNLGAAQLARGELAAAESTLAEAVDRCRASGASDRSFTAALGNLAVVRRDLGRRSEALELFAEEEQRCRSADDEYGLQASLGNQAQLLRELGRHDEAMTKLRQQEHISRDLADAVAIARSLAGQAAVLADRGDLAAAVALTEQHIALTRQEGDVRGLTEALMNQAVNRNQLGDITGAEVAINEAQDGARRLADPGLLARVLVARASTISSRGDWPATEAVAREAELTARSAGLPRLVAEALSIVGTARREQGDLAGCRAVHQEELAAATAGEDDAAIATAQTNLGNVAIAEQQLDEALQWYAAAEPTFRRLDIPAKLLPLLANRGQIHQMTNRFPEAVADLTGAATAADRMGNHVAVRQWAEPALGLAYQIGDMARAETLWTLLASSARATGDDAMLQKALGDGALLLINRAQRADGSGTVDQALLGRAAAMLDDQEEICRRTADMVGLAACVGNRAIVLRYQGDLDGSLRCLDEQLSIARASGNAQGALFATANRGEVLGLLGRTTEALTALADARATAAQYGLSPMVQQLDQMIAALRPR